MVHCDTGVFLGWVAIFRLLSVALVRAPFMRHIYKFAGNGSQIRICVRACVRETELWFILFALLSRCESEDIPRCTQLDCLTYLYNGFYWEIFLHIFCVDTTEYIFRGNQRRYKTMWTTIPSIQISWTFIYASFVPISFTHQWVYPKTWFRF